MVKVNSKQLIHAAARARQQAAAKHSGFRVGAALLTRRGRIFTGANVESDSYGLTCCAERVALFKALTEGEHELTAVAVVARTPGGPMPCGACRQLLMEYAPDAEIWIADTRRLTQAKRFSLRELLAHPFLLKG